MDSRAKAYQTVQTHCPENPSRFFEFCLALVVHTTKVTYIQQHNGLFLFIIFIS